MIEETVFNYLKYHLSVPVYTNEPEKKDPEYVVLEKTGGNITNKITESTIAIQCYGKTKYRACALMEEVITTMTDGLITLDDISEVVVNGSSDFTDTTTKRPRYQSIFIITHY